MNLAEIVPRRVKSYAEKKLEEYLKSLVAATTERYVGMPNTPRTQEMFAANLRELNRELEQIVITARIN